ncbi:MAG: 2-dehydro-3-deoxygalactonokinase [Bacteroidota bacterium]
MGKDLDWFWSVDWGTSRLRIALVNRHDGSWAQSREYDLGIWRLYQEWEKAAKPPRLDFYLERLFALYPATELGNSPQIPSLISGMASASIGLKELPYAQAPFALSGEHIYSEWVRKDVLLISGLQLGTDLMRGEETQCLGLEWRGDEAISLLLPGTHSKHLRIEAQHIKTCQTIMTGELYSLLSQQSILRDSLAGSEAFDEVAFKAGLDQSLKSPLSANLFSIRSAKLLQVRSKSSNADYLSGLLIGAECQMLATDRVVLVAGDSLRERYSTALAHLKPEIELICLAEDEAKLLVSEGQRKILNAYIAPGLS